MAQEFSSIILQTKGAQLSTIVGQLEKKFKGTICETPTKELIASFQ